MKKTPPPSKTLNFNFKFFDYALFTVIVTLILVSLTMLYSVSSIQALNKYQSSVYFLKKQVLWSFAGFIAMIVVIFTDLERLREYIPFMVLGTAFLLLVTLFMPAVQHVHRWIPLGFMRFQTSELAKIIVVLFIADYFDRNFSKIAASLKYIVKPFLIVSVLLVLIALEPDLGTPALLFAITLSMMYVSGVKLKYLLMPVLLAIPVFIIELIRHPYRLVRLRSWLSPLDHMKDETYQLSQSLIAIGSGGWFGVGFGASNIKLSYLPELHTDFIFPIMAEEFGLAGAMVIIGVFLFFLFRGLSIAKHARSHYLSLVAAGATLLIVFQAFFNIAMTAGLIPTKGLPLPFFSYGGSSVITTLILCGLILNISLRRKTTV